MATIETKKVTFTGSNGESHTIDCGMVTQGKDKGEARKRLSGAQVLSYLTELADSGASPEEVLSALLGTKSLGVAADDGPRDEQYDSLFESYCDEKRASASTFPLAAFRKQAVMSVCEQKGWTSLSAYSEHEGSIAEAFTAWAVETSADAPSTGNRFKVPVERRKGQQNVVFCSPRVGA